MKADEKQEKKEKRMLCKGDERGRDGEKRKRKG